MCDSTQHKCSLITVATLWYLLTSYVREIKQLRSVEKKIHLHTLMAGSPTEHVQICSSHIYIRPSAIDFLTYAQLSQDLPWKAYERASRMHAHTLVRSNNMSACSSLLVPGSSEASTCRQYFEAHYLQLRHRLQQHFFFLNSAVHFPNTNTPFRPYRCVHV